MKTRPIVITATIILLFTFAIVVGKDNLFLTQVHPDFDENILGRLSLRTCMGNRAYKVKYIINDDSQAYIWVSIDEIVDMATWKKVPDDIAAVSNYEDANHLYGIHCMSDVWVTCRKKCL